MNSWLWKQLLNSTKKKNIDIVLSLSWAVIAFVKVSCFFFLVPQTLFHLFPVHRAEGRKERKTVLWLGPLLILRNYKVCCFNKYLSFLWQGVQDTDTDEKEGEKRSLEHGQHQQEDVLGTLMHSCVEKTLEHRPHTKAGECDQNIKGDKGNTLLVKQTSALETQRCTFFLFSCLYLYTWLLYN